MMFLPLFLKSLGSYQRFSATSVDQLPHHLVAYLMFGHHMLLPIADVDHTDFMLILGANPAVSNGSLLSAPGLSSRRKKIVARGGSVVVLDPRYTESASVASEHLFIRPGTDVSFLAGMLRLLVDNGMIRTRTLQDLSKGSPSS